METQAKKGWRDSLLMRHRIGKAFERNPILTAGCDEAEAQRIQNQLEQDRELI